MKPTIELQNDLASYPQVNLFVYQLLTAAQAGGMTEPRATKLYDEIHMHFANLQGAAFWHFRDGLIRVLVMPDEAFDSSDGEDFDFSDRMN